MYRVAPAMAIVTIVIASLLLTSGTVSAHERRMVGPYQIEVGWESEPAYVGQLNSLHLEVLDGRTNKPVLGLEKTLTANVAAGGLAPFGLELSASAEAGTYNGTVIPTVTGTYTFHITGKIEAQTIDEKFQSGPNTFGDIENTAALQYPTKVPVADDLGKKLDAIQSGVDQTRLIALGAILLGVIAVGTSVMAGRRRA